jgi:hypothetical protein
VDWARRGRVIVGTTAIATFATIVAACDGTYDFPADRRWESTHFAYQTRASETQICPDVLGPLEEHFALLQDYLGFDWPPDAKVTYEKMLDAADAQAHSGCPLERGACAVESMVVSAEPMHLHELVHAYLWPTGFPPTVLVEGAAVALSCGSLDFGEVKPTESWDQLASLGYGGPDDNEVYAAGAWLVGYVLHRYDPRLFRAVYQRLADDADAATMDGVFRDVYGDSLEAIWAAALAEGGPHDFCAWQCSRPPVPIDGTPVATTDGVCGTLEVYSSITLASTSTLRLSTTASGVQLQACDLPPLPEGNWVGPGMLGLYELPAGAYFLDSSPGSAAATVTIDGSFSSVLTPTCQQATNLAPFQGVEALRVFVPNNGTDWFLPLPPPPAGKSTIFVSSGGALAAICSTCDAASCVFPSAPAPATPGQTLKIETVNLGGLDRYDWITVTWL